MPPINTRETISEEIRLSLVMISNHKQVGSSNSISIYSSVCGGCGGGDSCSYH